MKSTPLDASAESSVDDKLAMFDPVSTKVTAFDDVSVQAVAMIALY